MEKEKVTEDLWESLFPEESGTSLPDPSAAGENTGGQANIPTENAAGQEDFPIEEAVSQEDFPTEGTGYPEDYPIEEASSQEDFLPEEIGYQEDYPVEEPGNQEAIPAEEAAAGSGAEAAAPEEGISPADGQPGSEAPKGAAAVAEAMREAVQGEDASAPAPAPQAEEAPTSEEPEKKKKSKRPLIIAAVAVAALGIGYAAYAQQFEERFIMKTTINGIDVGGMTVEEAEDVLRQNVENYSLTIDLLGGHTHTIKSDDFDFTYLPGKRVKNLMEGQNRYTWGKGFVAGTPYEIETPASFSVDKLMEIVEGFEEVSGEGIVSPRDARMHYTKSGRFAIIPEVEGNEIDPAALTEAVLDCAARNEARLDAAAVDGIYLKPAVYADDEAMNERLDHLNKIFKVSISYNMPEEEGVMTFDSDDLIELTGLEENGYMYKDIDEETLTKSIRSFVAEMAETDIMTDRLPFKSTDLGTVYFDMGSTWGHVINQDVVAREMKTCFENGKSGTFDLTYTYQKDCPNSIGDTYIEVDIPTQSVYYYIDGDLVFYCGCVSGREYDRWTPTGIYSVIGKSRGIYLEGDYDEQGNPGYRSFVNFWMRFYAGYGLHDASWRSNSQFGTQTYLYSGSHGCVNLSYNSAQYLYENAPMGTPVLIVRN